MTEKTALKAEQIEAADVAAALSEGAPVASEPDAPVTTPTVETPAPETDIQTGEAPKDKTGAVHNPQIHQSPPKLSRKGEWMKKRGRGSAKLKEQAAAANASGSFAAKPTFSKAQQQQEAIAVQQRQASDVMRQEENKAAAIACTNALFAIGQAVGGPKFAPGAMVAKNGIDRKGEIGMLQSGFYETFEATGEAFKMPAWGALVIAVGTYGAARMGEKDVQDHVKKNILSRAFGPVGKWWRGRKARKTAIKVEKAKEKETTGEKPQDQSQWMIDNGFTASGTEGFA